MRDVFENNVFLYSARFVQKFNFNLKQNLFK